MRKSSIFLLIVALCMLLAQPNPVIAARANTAIPTFSIISINPNVSVTIRTFNFPPGRTFDALMGPMGSRGVNGLLAGTIASGSGGSFTTTINIPAALRGQYQIALRLQSTGDSGYYAYNWFYNGGGWVPPGTGPAPAPWPAPLPTPKPIPTFIITQVIPNVSITIQTQNFPANRLFDATMGYMGTRGTNGIWISVVNSGNGGVQTYTFPIPAALHGQHQIAIRLQNNTGSGYFAYNWFFNQP